MMFFSGWRCLEDLWSVYGDELPVSGFLVF